MSMRFRRTFRIAPGLCINLSKSGVSTSVGCRVAWFTIGPRGTRETIGAPGTGLSYTEHPGGCYFCRHFGERRDPAVWCARPSSEQLRS